MEKELWEKITHRTITAKEVVTIQNTEQKMAAMKFLGMEKVFAELGAKKIDTSKAGSEILWLVENVFIKPKYFLEKHDPSTDRVYFECVGSMEKLEKTVDEALRWQMDVNLEKYQTLTIRA